MPKKRLSQKVNSTLSCASAGRAAPRRAPAARAADARAVWARKRRRVARDELRNIPASLSGGEAHGGRERPDHTDAAKRVKRGREGVRRKYAGVLLTPHAARRTC